MTDTLWTAQALSVTSESPASERPTAKSARKRSTRTISASVRARGVSAETSKPARASAAGRRGREEPRPGSRAALERAVELEPGDPIYRRYG